MSIPYLWFIVTFEDPDLAIRIFGPVTLKYCVLRPEFSALFSRFGTVMHAVILATVDNASRRRGFVVMSSHEEAKRAMNALSRTQIKGHTLDVSWAVVQRSQDDADRTMMLASSNPSSHFRKWSSITNPHLLTISSPQYAFLEVAVEYVNVFDAQEAKDALQRQFYGTSRLEVRFIQDNIYPVNSTAAAYAQSPMLPKTSDAGLNPCAAPFVFGSRHLPPLASGLSAVAHDSFVNDLNLANRPSLHLLTPAERPSSGSTLVVEDLVKDLEFGICRARGGDQIMEDENGPDVCARARMQEERKTVAGSRNSNQPPVNGVNGNGHLSMNVSSSKAEIVKLIRTLLNCFNSIIFRSQLRSDTFSSLQPTYFPGFAFSWLCLVSHRLFMPKLLLSETREGWSAFHKLLLFSFKSLARC
ncbi:uncharacterized protein F5891DRAFT_1224807 [Suillus fuscotomentosus]|uniref:RRM domain-containing protein n=1 Tax=Suillus fuscotomentosus TaxID=1912939 RepID=A0AAD4HB51_9AGAM|nr:uncharacterized protein F5891DRAFT_1224807 [Suillus fuscotomentosus]KAG1886855.1 hypothetical protein F5891DRAFT_1224807 [Suillus fuscotomentosus]